MKKNITLAIVIFACSFVQAQVVNIPDPVFKNYLLANATINTNGDNDIQLTEAQAVSRLTVINNAVMSMEGIREFSNLRSLSIAAQDLASLDIQNMNQLDSLTITADSLNNLLFSGCSSLRIMDIFRSNLQSLDLRPLPVLKMIEITSNRTFSSIIAEDALSLQYFGLGNATNVDTIILKNCDSLTNFATSSSNNKLGFMDISGSDAIQDIVIQPEIQTLIANNCMRLRNLSVFIATSNMNGCDSLSLIGSDRLENISLYNVGGRKYDFSYLYNLRQLRLTMYSLMTGYLQLNLKNGSSLDLFELNTGQLDSVRICADDFEISSLENIYLTTIFPFNPLLFEISPYCSFGAHSNYNTISGTIRADINNNGCDPADASVSNIPVRILNNLSGTQIIRFSMSEGEYVHYVPEGNFTITPYFAYPYFSISPASQNTSFDTTNNLIDTVDFCVTPTATINNLEVTFLPTIRPARPGFDADYRLMYRNRGTTTLSGNVQLSFDQTRMNVLSSTINPTTSLPGQLSWNFSNLLPFETKTIDIIFNMLPPPINNIGDTIQFLAVVNPLAGDNTPADNSFILPQTIQGAYDPNDKQCMQGSRIDISKLGNDLYYLIRFQNKGTDTAFNVVIADTLSNHYDWDSFDLVTTSHPANVKRAGDQLEFVFADIKLPHEAINEPASHGFVAYRIKPKNHLIIGDSLNNKASIYFDYNLPIVTNIASTVVTALGPVPVRVEYFTGARKGLVNDLYWKAACSGNNSRFEIERSADGTSFVTIGTTTATDTRCLLPFNFTDNAPLKGNNFYRLKIRDENSLVSYSRTIQLYQPNSGMEIVNIVPSIRTSTVNIYSNIQRVVSIYMVGSDGKIMGKKSVLLNSGNNRFSMPHSQLAKGVYSLLIYSNSSGPTRKRFTW